MFNNGTGYHIHGGIFYNVGGDVNLRNPQTHHNLTIQNRHAGFQPLPGSTSGFEHTRSKASLKRRALTNKDLPEAGLDVPAHESDHDWDGVSRSERQGTAARIKPYDLGLRKRPSGKSLHDVLSDERSQASLSSSASIETSGGLPRPFPPTAPFNYHLPSTSSSLVPYTEIPQKNLPPSVHGGTFFAAANVNFYGTRKRRREEMSEEETSPTQTADKRRRLEEEDGIKIIPKEHLKLIHEIGRGPGYLLHAGRNNSRAVIVKVFNKGPTVRQQLESTVALSKELMHPNVLRIEGISSLASTSHFIVYENGHCKNAEGPLAAALKDDLARSITLGFKMIAGLSAGMNHLCLQGLSLGLMSPDNFDIFFDVDDRILISINPPQLRKVDTAGPQEPEDKAWNVFNALCRRVLTSANRVLYHEDIKRDPVPDLLYGTSHRAATSPMSFESVAAPQNIQQDDLEGFPVPPRREYVWRAMDRGQQSLSTVAHRLALDLDMNLPLLRLTQSDRQNPHRCPGYVREEITLATTTLASAVVSHDTPSALEICSVCHEVVGLRTSLPDHNLDFVSSRPLTAPIPGPLPSPGFSFGVANASSDSGRNSPVDFGVFSFLPASDADTEGDDSSASYQMSRFGSIASESRAVSAYFSDVGTTVEASDFRFSGRSESCPPGFLNLMSGLDVDMRSPRHASLNESLLGYY
ncbi:hypothetical protein B0H14DRAFT_3863713 [Mycena olivaceomarginata]|nr:hypothetical protein B0H14DRAFT_3863713 [Mycena olivaceomarginata]